MIDRRRFIKAASCGVAAAAVAPAALTSAALKRRPNVLMIVVDDLNDWIGPLGGHPQVHTPNLDRLAARGAVFANTSCPAPICTPARTAVLTGRHPSRSGLYFLAPLFRKTPALAHAVTLPQHFRGNGYRTMAIGKVFHGRNDPASLDEDGGITHHYGPRPASKLSVPEGHPLWDWGAYPTDGSPTPDDRIVEWAVDRLGREYDRPYFLAAGLIRPHVPMYAPPDCFEHYPPGATVMPRTSAQADAAIGDYAKSLTHAAVAPRHDYVLELRQWEYAVRCYLASITYMDQQVGRLLDSLERRGDADNTVIAFWSDHGFHLGEKSRWGKRSLWEESCRVPLILAGPGVPAGRTDQPTGTIDLYPTLTDLCGLPPQQDLDGHSLTALLQGGDDWPHTALTSFGPGNCAVRSRHHRYIRYADGSEELYDQRDDPNEWDNLAAHATSKRVLDTLRRALPDRHALLVAGGAGSDSPLFP